MSPVRLLGIILIVVGLIALAYGGFTYTHQTHEATIGSLKLSVGEKQTVPIPVWAGVGAVVIGALMMFGRNRT
jgi:TRAP-type C4-dicarboxylate transport system permease small subunit